MKSWLTNRVILGMLLFFGAVGAWEFYFKPQYRPLYVQGRSQYQQANYAEALKTLEQAYRIAPNEGEVITLLGWTHLKLNHVEEARSFF